MDKRQRTFLIVVAALVALFSVVLMITKAGQQQTIQKPPTPAATIALITALPSAQTTAALPVTTPTLPESTPTLLERTSTPKPLPTETTTATSKPVTPTLRSPKAWYIAPDGNKDGKGSKAKPWSLQYALDQPDSVKPGDTLWLKTGTYEGSFVCQLKGEEGKEITVRALPGERVILTNNDRVLDIASSRYVTFWGLEITQTENARDPKEPQETAYGVRINQGEPSNDIKFINMIVHDMAAQGFGWWQANTNSEIYGSLIYFNGITQFDHGIYLHNSEGKKSIIDNLIFDNASHGIHAYGEKDYQELNNIHIEGNTVFNNGSIGYTTSQAVWGKFKRNILVGGLLVAKNPVITNNYTYYPGTSGEALNLGYRAGSLDAVVEDNYFAGGQIELGGDNSKLKLLKNTILGFSLNPFQLLNAGQLFTSGENSVVFSRPNDAKIFVRPNQYEPGRANITVYNWAKRDEVRLTADDLKGVQIKKGDTYELHNAQDYFEDIITGTYDGEQISLPMTDHSVAQPLGLSFKPKTTFPEFGAFVIITKPAK